MIILEKRIQPRYEVDFPVSMRVGTARNPQLLAGFALTVSRASLEVECDSEAVRILREHREQNSACEVAFPLPGKEADCLLSCAFLGYRRVSQHRYQIVLAFSQPLAHPLASLAKSANDAESETSHRRTAVSRE